MLLATETAHLQARAKIDAVLHNGVTAVFAAAANEHLEIVRLLLQAGADKDAAAHDGIMPGFVSLLLKNGDLEIVRLLPQN